MSVEPIPTDTDDWREAIGLVLGNWRGELVLLAGEWMRALRQPAQDIARLSISPVEIVAWHLRDEQWRELGRFSRDADGADALATRLAQAELLHGGRADCVLQFDDAVILRSRARLPKTSETALRGAMGFELKRLSPVPPGELYFDVFVTRHDKATNRVELASRALRRRIADDAIAFAASAGLSVAAIRLGADARPADWRHYPVNKTALLRQAWKRWGSAALAVLAIVLLLATAIAALMRGGMQDATLSAHIADGQARAAIVSRIEHKTLALRDQAAFVADRKVQPSFLGTLAALTDVLPDGTWLINLQVADGKLHLQGYSHAASDLPVLLDRSGRFRNVQFGAPVVSNEADGTERFDLTADIVAGP